MFDERRVWSRNVTGTDSCTGIRGTVIIHPFMCTIPPFSLLIRDLSCCIPLVSNGMPSAIKALWWCCIFIYTGCVAPSWLLTSSMARTCLIGFWFDGNGPSHANSFESCLKSDTLYFLQRVSLPHDRLSWLVSVPRLNFSVGWICKDRKLKLLEAR